MSLSPLAWRAILCLSLFFVNAVAFASYTKISNSGQELPESAILGGSPNDWGCTRDNNTGLIWEIKTNDKGLRDQHWSYTWFNPDSSSNGGSAGIENGSNSNMCDKSSFCNTNDYVNRVNAQGLCGYKDWRVPNITELLSLIYCSKGKYNTLPSGSPGYICPENNGDLQPTIDPVFFPNTSIDPPHYGAFWSASSNALARLNAWYVLFLIGNVDSDGKGSSYTGGAIRLARGAEYKGDQSAANFGYIKGNILNACNQKPLKSVDLLFNNGRTQQSDEDGRYSIKLEMGNYGISVGYQGYKSDSQNVELQTNETRIVNFNLTPTEGCGNVRPANSKQAIIISGTGPKLPTGDNHIWEATQALADRAYTALRLQGFKREDIYYLTADPQLTSRDADGDGTNDINGAANLANLQQALTQWTKPVEQAVVYFIGHGGVDTYQLNRETQLSPKQLKIWLDSLQAKLIKDQRGQPGKLSVIIDACKAGSFVAPLAASNRYVVASTQPDLDAIISNKDGSNSFSYHFWGQIGFKDGWLSTAFQQARQSMSSELVDRGRTQKAILDANGSGDDTTEADYTAIGNYCYGNCTSHASVPIAIESVSPLDNLNGSFSSTLKVRASKAIAKAWVSIQRPDYHFPTDGTAINTLLTLNLNCDGGNSCQASYNNFNLNENYQVTFNVIDKDGNTAVPYTATLYQSGITASNDKKAAPAVYESSTGVLTLKDVIVDGKHYYVELKDQGAYRFSVENLFQLTEGANTAPASFDGSKVSIPSVYVLGQYYAVDLVSNGAVFVVNKAVPK